MITTIQKLIEGVKEGKYDAMDLIRGIKKGKVARVLVLKYVTSPLEKS